jgi:hypothetical protein
VSSDINEIGITPLSGAFADGTGADTYCILYTVQGTIYVVTSKASFRNFFASWVSAMSEARLPSCLSYYIINNETKSIIVMIEFQDGYTVQMWAFDKYELTAFFALISAPLVTRIFNESRFPT